MVDIELAKVVSQTMDVSVELLGEHLLSPAYQIQDTIVVTPAQVTVIGAAPTIGRISQIQVETSVAEGGMIRQTVPVRAVAANGNEITGLTFQPAQAQVAVTVERRSNARDVGVQAITVGNFPTGYRLRRLTTTPEHLILLGDPEQLTAVENAVETVPIDVSQLVGNLSIKVPLSLPPGVEALDNNGNSVISVQVEIEVVAETGTLLVTRPVELPENEESNVAVEPSDIELLLSGPIPLLNQIETNPNLVRVFINADDLSELTADTSRHLTPHVVAPENITVQLIPASVQITRP